MHFATPFPNLLDFPPGFFGSNPDILIKILQALVAADLHSELRGSACQELIGAKRPSASVSGDPGVLRLGAYNILVTSFVRCLYRSIDSGQPRDLLDMPV